MMTKDIQLKLLSNMLRIRMVEEEIAIRYPEGKMRCPTHLSIGQEAVPAAIAEVIRPNDFAVSTHRGHAHYLGKGGNLKAMLAEIYGKVTGCARGKGGSMHLIDRSVGFMGTSAIVGNSIPVGVGLAMSSQIKKTGQIACIFLGEGATEEGAYYESVNFAVLKNLPVLFLCENNLYSVYSPLSVRQPESRQLTEVARSMGLNTGNVNGNDVEACYAAIRDAASNIREGKGPYFLEFSTYRWREHCGPNFDNDLGYRTIEEYDLWKQKDPILKLENEMIAAGRLKNEDIQGIKDLLNQEIAEAFAFAESSAFPDAEEAYIGEYA